MNWIAPSSLHNYMLRDPICDWLDRFSHILKTQNPIFSSITYPTSTLNTITLSSTNHVNHTSGDRFLDFLLDQGIKFEKKVISLIKHNYPTNFIDISSDQTISLEERYQTTIESMINGIPIIYQGVLIDDKDKIRGIPDLLIRSDFLSKIVVSKYLTSKEEKR